MIENNKKALITGAAKGLGRPEEVANAIKFMLSDDSSYMNGHSLVLDGGMDAG